MSTPLTVIPIAHPSLPHMLFTLHFPTLCFFLNHLCQNLLHYTQWILICVSFTSKIPHSGFPLDIMCLTCLYNSCVLAFSNFNLETFFCLRIFFTVFLFLTLSEWLVVLSSMIQQLKQEDKNTWPQISPLLNHTTVRQKFLILEIPYFHTGSQEKKSLQLFSSLKTEQTSGSDQIGSEGRSTFMVDGWKMVLLWQILDQHTREWIWVHICICVFLSLYMCVCFTVACSICTLYDTPH